MATTEAVLNQNTSVTRQRTLLRCPKKYEYHYIRRIRPRREDDRFLLGRAVHVFLEHYYGAQLDNIATKDEAFQYAFGKFREYVTQNFPTDDQAFEQADLAEGMIKHYHSWAKIHDNFTVVGTEIPFEVPVLQSTNLVGIFDGIVEMGGKYWILEHKTASQINTRHVLRDKQVSMYVSAARMLGIPVEGVIYNTLRKGLPQKPALLKKGGLSRSLSNNITYESYLEAIEEHGLSPEDYQEQLNVLKERENPFFHREFVPRTEGNDDQVWEDVQKTEELRAILVKNNIFPRNDTKDCAWDCPYAELCLAEFEGHDTEQLFIDKYVYLDQ